MRTICQWALVLAAILTCATTPAADAALPAFTAKVQLHNLAGAVPTENGTAIRLHRLPAAVRARLTETNKASKKTGADTMLVAKHGEIRFVLEEGEKVENVKLHLQCGKAPATVTFYWGDIYSSHRRIPPQGRAKPIGVTGHGLLFNLIDKIPRGRYASRVCRAIVDGANITFHGIDGKVRPPRPEELPPVMLSYGTSISQGYAASRPDLQWNSLTARSLGYDLVNLGSSGTAFLETAMADYLAAQPWDLAVLEISVNMVGNFDTPEFEKRAAYMVKTLAESHPDKPIFCLSILPWGVGHYWSGDGARKTKEFREALKAIVAACGHDNVHYVHGPDVLSFAGLYHDMLHPSDMGMIEMATKLSAHIRGVVEE